MKLKLCAAVLLIAASAATCDVHIDRRTTANETVTSQNLRKIRSMLFTYRNECGGFPARLQGLLAPATASECNVAAKTDSLTKGGNAVIDAALLQAISAGPVSGYRYVYAPIEPMTNASTLFLRFTLQASPVESGISGEAQFLATDSEDVRSSRKSP